MTDLIKRDDALAACDIAPPDEWNDYTKGGYDFAAEECKRNIAALPAVTVGVKPLEWHDWGFTYHAFDPIDGQTIHAETKEDIDHIEAERQQRILAALEPQPIDPAAVTMGVKPLNQFGVRELARAAGISPTTAMRVKRGEGDLDGATLRAVLAATGTCLCCGKEPQPAIDPAAIREAALREALDACTYVIKNIDILKADGETYETTRIQKIARGLVDVARQQIEALIGEKK